MDYLEHKQELDALADKVVYTKSINTDLGYQFELLESRSVQFETEMLDKPVS